MSYFFRLNGRSHCFSDDSILFIVNPTFVNIIGNTASIISNNSYQVRARHTGSKVTQTLTAPTVELDIIKQMKLVCPLISFILNNLVNWGAAFSHFQKSTRLFVVLSHLFIS